MILLVMSPLLLQPLILDERNSLILQFRARELAKWVSNLREMLVLRYIQAVLIGFHQQT